MATLTEKRAADRAAMATEIQSIAVLCGAASSLDVLGPRWVRVEITAARGLCVGIDFDGESAQPDVHVIPWHITYTSDAKLAPSFGDVNPHHFAKATHVAYGFDALCAEVRRGLTAAADGSAFQA